MSRRSQLIRLAGSCLCLLASVFFCHRFSAFQYDALVFGAGFEPRDLPTMCIWFVRYSPLLLAMPIGREKLRKIFTMLKTIFLPQGPLPIGTI